MRFKLTLAALAATVAFASPAMAQTAATASAKAKGTVLQKLTFVQVAGRDLDFGTVLASGTSGTVSIDADSGGRSFTGGVTLLSVAAGDRALFAGVGTDGQQVDIHLAPPASLGRIGGGASVTVNSMSLDSNGVGTATDRTITINDVNGAFQVGVGGTFDIAANQLDGVYEANFDVTVDY
jgi:Domain of unknown function (DUF4402)